MGLDICAIRSKGQTRLCEKNTDEETTLRRLNWPDIRRRQQKKGKVSAIKMNPLQLGAQLLRGGKRNQLRISVSFEDINSYVFQN